MNTLLAVIIGALTVYLAYTRYARRIDRHVIQSDPKRATPATLYMDGVDCWFQDFGIPVGGVVVNMLLDRQALGENAPDFVVNRIQMQDEHMKTIWEKFDGSVRAVVPLFDQEVRGTAMLEQAGLALFGAPDQGTLR